MGDRHDESVTRRLARLGGDRPGFEALFHRLAPAVHAWARLRLPVDLRVVLDADDVAQEAWLRVYNAFATYDPERGSFRPWLFKVAKHALLDLIRRARVRQPRLGRLLRPADASVHLSRLRDEVTTLSRRLARDETLERFLDQASRLDPADRLLLVHIGLEGLTVAEAALRSGLSRPAAYKRWQRLRARLASEGLLGRLMVD